MSFKDYPADVRLAMYEEDVLYYLTDTGEIKGTKGKPYPEGYYFFKEDVTNKDGNIGCSDCVGCKNCNNCVGCVDCVDCKDCVGCTDCKYIRESTDCAHCAEGACLKDCTRCSNVSYLINCTFCYDCASCTNCHFCDDRYRKENLDGRKPSFSKEFLELYGSYIS